ncbi:uncharacterized protein [Littorina saxatilis]|uniref:Uncharacterized protein n=1 Tax=Littorina saxatilis TaxID=31220 RepID=A0AAN9C0S0_9CAEN
MRNVSLTCVIVAVTLTCLVITTTGTDKSGEPRTYSGRRGGSGMRRVCVTVRTGYGSGQTDRVLTCDAGNRLKSEVKNLKDDLNKLKQNTENTLQAQMAMIDQLKADVLRLQGVGVDPLQRVLFDLPTTPNFTGEVRQLCEIYTSGEASIICQEFGFPDNPNIHYVHIPCGNDCPERTWKYEPGCSAINTPFPEVLLKCFYDPLLRNETCTSPVYLACEGYTNTFSDEFKEMVVPP